MYFRFLSTNQYCLVSFPVSLLLLLLFLSDYNPHRNVNQRNKPLTVSHRGYAGLYPENTLVGIREALTLGVDYIEIDIHQSKDGVLVLMHDISVDRTTNGKGKIKDLSLKELKALHIPYLNTGADHHSTSISIPTLSEVLSLVDGKAFLLIEIKKGGRYYPGIEEKLVRLIRQKKASDWCVIQSFDQKCLYEINTTAPDLQVMRLLFFPFFRNFEKQKYLTGYSIYHGFISQNLVERIHENGQLIFAWTVNDSVTMEKLAKRNVDGWITDYPNRVPEFY